ncbi:pentapeptide repeat-containing protein [Burkholderia vietnamiensis]|uniref:pentapeptide repeat-containing protein n=1 Tax=Burkholderia vietnamiensis TaxID=60552 RepID=UPI001E3CA9DF|nr:pentapeptide repeat-containing protein [Burkholderia vietnamiensis]
MVVCPLILDKQIKSENYAEYCQVLSGERNGKLGSNDARGSNFSGARFVECDFSATRLDDARLVRTSFENCDLSGVDFRGANLEGVDFHGGTFWSAPEGSVLDRRCEGCGQNAVSTCGHPLPPQNLHQHTANQGRIRWRLDRGHVLRNETAPVD